VTLTWRDNSGTIGAVFGRIRLHRPVEILRKVSDCGVLLSPVGSSNLA
jgi:hypothetical protein